MIQDLTTPPQAYGEFFRLIIGKVQVNNPKHDRDIKVTTAIKSAIHYFTILLSAFLPAPLWMLNRHACQALLHLLGIISLAYFEPQTS